MSSFLRLCRLFVVPLFGGPLLVSAAWGAGLVRRLSYGLHSLSTVCVCYLRFLQESLQLSHRVRLVAFGKYAVLSSLVVRLSQLQEPCMTVCSYSAYLESEALTACVSIGFAPDRDLWCRALL